VPESVEWRAEVVGRAELGGGEGLVTSVDHSPGSPVRRGMWRDDQKDEEVQQ